MSRILCKFKLIDVVLRLAALACLTACELETGLIASSNNEIVALGLRTASNAQLSQDVSASISDNSITLDVPAGTDVTALVPTIHHTGESISPASGEARDFSDPVEYVVTASDGSERVYTVTVFVAAASSKDIRTFRIGSTPATIDGTDISLTLAHGTNRTSLRAVVSHTGGGIDPASGSEQDFSVPVTYTVTAQDGSTRIYTVTVNEAPSSSNDLTSFEIGGRSAEIHGRQVTLTLPNGSDVRALEPSVSHTGVSVDPESGSAQDFRGPVMYTVTAADGSTQVYTVLVSVAQSDANDITELSIDGVAAAISDSTITLTLPFGTDVTYLAPVVQHTGKSLSPASTAPRDFTQPVSYTVTAADGSTKQYTVTVSIAPNTAKQIIDFVILGSTGQISDTTITLTLPYGADPAALIPTVIHTGAQLSPASGVMQNFSAPRSYVVMAADGSSRTYTVIVTVAPSGAKDITQFSLLNVAGNIANDAISLTLPYGSDVSAVAPQLVHTGASIEPASGQTRDFRTPQTYTVTAHDGSTRVYTLNVSIASNSAKAITHFALLDRDAEIDGTDITLTLPYGSDVSALTPDIMHTGASISPGEATPQDFRQPVTYTVTAANNSHAVYTVTVTIAANSAKAISALSILNVQGSIGLGTVTLTVPFGTDLHALAPTITTTGVSVSPPSGVAQDFSQPVTYTVRAEDESTKDYVVTVSAALSDAKEITGFSILGKSSTIQNNDITLTLPYGTSPSSLAPSIMITGKNVEPASGVPQDFSSPVTYRVTAQDDTYKDFTVTVTIAHNDAKNITGFSILGTPAQIGTNTVTLTLPYGTSPTALTPQISISGESVAPLSNVPQDFTAPRTYKVTASDGTEKDYTVTVVIARNDAKNILTFDVLGVTPTIGANTVSLTVPYGTNPSALTPTISSSGVSISPATGVVQNFTGPVDYTVTADDGTTKLYTVTVHVAQNNAKNITSFSILNIPGNVGANAISLTVPYGTNPSALVPTISSTGQTVSPASGVPHDFSGSTNYTVTAEDGTTKIYAVTVTVALNDTKSLTSFSILGVPGNIGTNTVALTVPYGTSLSALTPTLASSGQSVSPATNVPHDFTNPASYVVTAEDGSMKTYTVTVSVAQNDAKNITSFTILGVSGNITGGAIALTVPYGTNPNALVPTIVSTGSSVSPVSLAANDFTSPTTYVVTAEDGTTKPYTVTVTVALNSAKDISAFEILGVQGNVQANTISLTVPYGTNPNGLTPAFTTTGQSVSPATGVPNDFTTPRTYTVTAQDGTTKPYTVTVNIAQNSAKEITHFEILGVTGNIGLNTITLTVPYGTNPNALTPTISSTGQSTSPATGVPHDFTNPASYIVSAEDGSMHTYTVTVTVAQNSAKDITSFAVLGNSGSVGSGTVSLTVPYGTSLTSLTPTIAISGQTISPASGDPQNFTNPVLYTVTAQNGTTQQYTVTVTAAANSAKDISTFSILGLSGTVGANTITLTVPYGTNLTNLTPAITVTGNAVSPASGVANDFSSPATYRVTADNTSFKDYTVTVVAASAATDCRALLSAFPSTTDGAYTIDPDGTGGLAPFPVYCDMTNHGGGWTLIGKTAAGDYTGISSAAFVDLIVNPGSDVNADLLQTATVPSAGEIAFFSRAKTNALYHASGALRAVRVNLSGHMLAPSSNGTYFQQRVSAPSNWDFWLALRNARQWNSDGNADVAPNQDFVAHFGTDFVLTNVAGDFNASTNVVTHRGDGTFGFFSMYTHTLPDTSTVVVSRHLGLLNDGVDSLGYLWLLTADPIDSRYRNDATTLQKSLIWLR